MEGSSPKKQKNVSTIAARMSPQQHQQKEKFYYGMFSKGRENTEDADMKFKESDLNGLIDLGLLMCSRLVLPPPTEQYAPHVFRNEIWTNENRKESIDRIDQFYIDAGFQTKPGFEGLLFQIRDDDPFAIDRVFKALKKINYTSAENYHSDANIILCDNDTVRAEYLSIFMKEDEDDEDSYFNRDISE
jgi:hypothetical protein